jgi:hypothetical protein
MAAILFWSGEEADAGVIVRSSHLLLPSLAASPKIGDPAKLQHPCPTLNLAVD